MEEENEKHTETVHTMKNNETDTPNSPEALDSDESGTENGSDTEEETFILNDYELTSFFNRFMKFTGQNFYIPFSSKYPSWNPTRDMG